MYSYPISPSRLGHFFQRRATVALSRVHMQVAANVAQFDQLRQRPCLRRFDLALVLAQLRRNPFQPQRLINLFFRRPRDHSLRIDPSELLYSLSVSIPIFWARERC